MRTLATRRVLPGASAAEAEALWLDLNRWSSFVDGLARVDRVEGDWPNAGTRLIWDSRAGGRGRVVENVVAYEPGRLQRARVEDLHLTGTQAVAFADAAITLELSYELKRPGVAGALSDLFFIRHQLRESLRRTLARFAVELAADRELAS